MTDAPTILFRLGRAILALDPNPLSREEAGTWIGKLRKSVKDDGVVANILVAYAEERPAEPKEWLSGALRSYAARTSFDAWERRRWIKKQVEKRCREVGIDPLTDTMCLSREQFRERMRITREVYREAENMPNQPETAGRSASAVADR